MFLRFFLLITVFLGGCSREMNIIPGMTWTYYSQRHSRVVWDGYGVIADGDVVICFYEYGFSFLSNCGCQYVDMAQKALTSNKESLGNGTRFLAMDAASALGIFTDESHLLFQREMKALQERVKRKARIDERGKQ